MEEARNRQRGNGKYVENCFRKNPEFARWKQKARMILKRYMKVIRY
jgi:hypothetical protein